MKRLAPSRGFTLIEMITVVAIIVLLAGLIISTAGYANRKAALERATNEIKALGTAIDAYKIDNGGVPQNKDTDLLDPRIHFSAIGGSGDYYQKASVYLYSTLPETSSRLRSRMEGRRRTRSLTIHLRAVSSALRETRPVRLRR
jgi:prepilin-type N-terminal cleavage/methylation domain-containing protein